MQLSTTDGKTFTLRSETDADQQLLDQLEDARAAYVTDIQRVELPGGGFTTDAISVVVDRQGETALIAQSGRQALSALRQLISLVLREAADHRHVSTAPTNPQTQEELATVLVQIQVMLEVLRDAIVKLEIVVKEVHSAHGIPLVVQSAIVGEGGAA